MEDTRSTLVSVVIPTHGRPREVVRAVKSVLAQDYYNLEVNVIIDGPDAEAEAALRDIEDSRLLVLTLPRNVGGADARNAGVQVARGEWVAFLDDDDEWLPSKLTKQMQLALSVPSVSPIVSCRFIARIDDEEFTWPKRLPGSHEPISEYLLSRHGLGRNDGFISTITVLTKRALLCAVKFRSGLKRHQDWDWVLRAVGQEGADVYFCPEALAIVNMEQRESVSRRADWRYSMVWIDEMRTLVTARAYAGFITAHVAWQAARQGDWKACFPLIMSAFRNGSPNTTDVIRFFGFWLIPQKLRHRLGTMFA